MLGVGVVKRKLRYVATGYMEFRGFGTFVLGGACNSKIVHHSRVFRCSTCEEHRRLSLASNYYSWEKSGVDNEESESYD